MKELKVKPILTRNWKDKNVDLVVERDKDRKKSQETVDKRIYYMWFNYLKLCLNLEEINYSVEKKGAKGIVVDKTSVKVNKKIYKDWDLKDLYTMNFKKWYKGTLNIKNCLLKECLNHRVVQDTTHWWNDIMSLLNTIMEWTKSLVVEVIFLRKCKCVQTSLRSIRR